MDEELRTLMEKKIKQLNLTEEQEIFVMLYCKIYFQEGYKEALQLIDRLIPISKDKL